MYGAEWAEHKASMEGTQLSVGVIPELRDRAAVRAGLRSYLGFLGAPASQGAHVPRPPGHPSLRVFLQRKMGAFVFQNWKLFFLLWSLFNFCFTPRDYSFSVLVYTQGMLGVTPELGKCRQSGQRVDDCRVGQEYTCSCSYGK